VSARELTLAAPAKANLFLEVLRRRPDGFHDLVSVFAALPLADRLEIAPEEEALVLVCDDPEVPVDGRNLVLRAAALLREEAGIRAGARFRLHKRIPIGGGLGGGSSDAAAALRLGCRLWGLPEEADTLSRLAARLGSDVPFFLHGGICLCEGRGEIVTPLADAKAPALALALPPWGVSTPAAYAALAGRPLGGRPVGPFLRALSSGDPEAVAREAFNRFEEAVFDLEPRERTLHEALVRAGARPRMSGSGSSIWMPKRFVDARVREAAAGIRLEGADD